MQECGSKRLNKDEVDFIVKSVEKFEPTETFVEKSLSPKMLFFGLNGIGRTEPDGKVDFKLWDRVVNCRSDCACPLGWRGTVIGIVPETKGIISFIASVTACKSKKWPVKTCIFRNSWCWKLCSISNV